MKNIINIYNIVYGVCNSSFIKWKIVISISNSNIKKQELEIIWKTKIQIESIRNKKVSDTREETYSILMRIRKIN